jgi:hypothetical protein
MADDWTNGMNHSTPEFRWQGTLAAAWPALGALACAAFALAPARFPADTGQTIALLAVAELPALFLGVAHAEAMKEGSRSGRYLSYIIGIIVVLLAFGLHLVLAIEARYLMPMFGWVVVGHLVNLYTGGDDPKLAHDRAWAELFDKATLLGLIPSLVVAIALTGLCLHLAAPAFGFDFDRWTNAQVRKLEATDFAWFAAAYLALAAGSAAYSHGPGFARHRRRWLDRPLLNRLTRK